MRARLQVSVTPADVGRRVTLRLHTREEDQPAFTDVVGHLLSWEGSELRVQRRTGQIVRVGAVDLVAGRVIPDQERR